MMFNIRSLLFVIGCLAICGIGLKGIITGVTQSITLSYVLAILGLVGIISSGIQCIKGRTS